MLPLYGPLKELFEGTHHTSNLCALRASSLRQGLAQVFHLLLESGHVLRPQTRARAVQHSCLAGSGRIQVLWLLPLRLLGIAAQDLRRALTSSAQRTQVDHLDGDFRAVLRKLAERSSRRAGSRLTGSRLNGPRVEVLWAINAQSQVGRGGWLPNRMW